MYNFKFSSVDSRVFKNVTQKLELQLASFVAHMPEATISLSGVCLNISTGHTRSTVEPPRSQTINSTLPAFAMVSTAMISYNEYECKFLQPL